MVKRSNPFGKYALSSKKARKYRPGGTMSRVLMPSSRYRGRGELKSVDGVSGTSTNIVVPLNTANSNLFLCNGLVVGPNYYQRVGRRIEMASLHLKGVITQTSNHTTVMDYCRLAVVYDRQANGVATVSNIIFQDIDSSAMSLLSKPASGVNPNERERYLVLADIKLALPPTTSGQFSGTDGVLTTFNINRFIKLKGLRTHYQDDTDLIGSISTGALYVVGMGNLASGSEGWQFVGTWRLRYADT